MPSFYIQSLFERQHGKYCERHQRVRRELDDFVDFAELLGGKEVADVFRAYVGNVLWGWRYRGERLPEIPTQGVPFLDEFLQLNRRDSALVLKMRNSRLWCYDSLPPPYVLWCYCWHWDEIESLLNEDRRLPLKDVRMLLEVLLNEEPRFPTAKEIVAYNMAPGEVEGWERTFRHKRRNIVWLFQAALRLGEEIVYSTI
jgi:hypothetical protein